MWANNGGQNKKDESWWLTKQGYVAGRVRREDGTLRNTRFHRHLIEQHMGRELLPHEDVHHKDGNKLNNRLDNLEVISHGEHSRLTNRERWAKARGES